MSQPSWSKHRNNKSIYFMGSLQKLSNLKLVKHLRKVALVSAHYMLAMIIIMKHRSLKDFQSPGPLTGLHLYFLSVDKAASQQTPPGGLYTYHTFCLMSPQLLFIFFPQCLVNIRCLANMWGRLLSLMTALCISASYILGIVGLVRVLWYCGSDQDRSFMSVFLF